MLTRYVAAAAVNADRFNTEYRLDLYARRVMDLTENIANEKELSELPGRIFTRAKELLNAHRARLYFVAPGDGPIEHRLVQSPFVVRFMFERSPEYKGFDTYTVGFISCTVVFGAIVCLVSFCDALLRCQGRVLPWFLL